MSPLLRLICMGLLALLGLHGVAILAHAQAEMVQVQVEQEDIGLNGVLRVGEWTPIRVRMTHRGNQPRAIICRWVLRDSDGDRVLSERRVTLTPQIAATTYLYAPVPVNQSSAPWLLQIVDADSQTLLSSRFIAVPDQYRIQDIQRNVSRPMRLHADVGAIGLCGTARMGLEPYTGTHYTQHEQQMLVTELSLEKLPDRWYGLSLLSALVWTPQGGDPNAMPEQVQLALRQWVERGGHLVIVMPLVGELWTSSPLADMLPITSDQIVRINNFDPLLLGSVPDLQPDTGLPALTFRTQSGQRAEPVLYADPQNKTQPYVVASRYGFGRVTMIGIDLSSPAVRDMTLPNGLFRIWNNVFHWQSPIFSQSVIDSQSRSGEIFGPLQRQSTELGSFMSRMINMRSTARATLGLAALLLVVYWLVAGPISFSILKSRGLQQHTWIVFACTVILFSVIAWGGAMVLRPQQQQLEHFSVVDVDLHTGTTHVHSHLSILVPTFGDVRFELAPDAPAETYNTLANIGIADSFLDTMQEFLDPQTYNIQAANPRTITIPMRSTAKQFTADYLGSLSPSRGLAYPWPTPRVQDLALDERGLPQGRVTHRYPGVVENVLAIYAPGDGQTALVWRIGDWAPNQPLSLRPQQGQRLVVRMPRYESQRNWNQEGYLGQLVGRRLGIAFSHIPTPTTTRALLAPDTIIEQIEMLSFFSTLPPPNFRSSNQTGAQHRPIGRELDMTALLSGKRIILIGHMQNAPLPLPFLVDAEEVEEQSGWVTIRCILDLHP